MKRVENIVTKEKIAHHEKFLLSPQCFQKASAAEVYESIYGWERVKTSDIHCSFPSVRDQNCNFGKSSKVQYPFRRNF